MVIRLWEVKGEVQDEVRYYVSRLRRDAKRLAEAVRGHWGIENRCPWLLAVAFREDDSRLRAGHAAENLGA